MLQFEKTHAMAPASVTSFTKVRKRKCCHLQTAKNIGPYAEFIIRQQSYNKRERQPQELLIYTALLLLAIASQEFSSFFSSSLPSILSFIFWNNYHNILFPESLRNPPTFFPRVFYFSFVCLTLGSLNLSPFGGSGTNDWAFSLYSSLLLKTREAMTARLIRSPYFTGVVVAKKETVCMPRSKGCANDSSTSRRRQERGDNLKIIARWVILESPRGDLICTC